MKKHIVSCITAFAFVLNVAAQPAKSADDYYNDGLKLLDKEQYEEALTAFKNAIAKDPSNEQALYRAGWCCNELELFNDAVTYLEKASKLNDKEAKTFFELAYAFENLSKNDDALKNYQKTVDLYPGYYDAYMKIGNIYYAGKDYKSALDNYKQYLSGTEPDNFYYYRAAWCCNDLAQYEEAISYLNNYNPESDDDNTKKYDEIAYSYYQLEKNDDAIAAYKKALEYSPDHGAALRGLGNVYYEHLEDYEQARKYFELALAKDEENSKAYYYKLGWIYNDKEEYDAAVSILKKAVDYDPEDPGNREELGYAYYMTSKYENALVELKKAVELDANSKLGYYYMGLCYVDMGRKDDAMDVYNKLKKISEEQAAKLLDKINGK